MGPSQTSSSIVRKLRHKWSTKTPYTYDPLDEVAHQIRLLTLHPGRFNDPLRVSLTIVPFTPEHIPTFEALSYVWGSPEKPTTIFVGESGYETLSATRNLGIALPYLRYEDRSRVMWIDAICVNQKNYEERSQQVKRMTEIYSKASRVVAWLGPASETTADAIECFNTIASHIDVNWGLHEMRAVSVDTSWADRKSPPPFSKAASLAILEFLSFEWFERLWVYQEIQLASDDAIIQCGQQVVKWPSFRSAVFFLRRKDYLLDFPTDRFEILGSRIGLVYNICNRGGYQPLESLLQLTKKCKCSDPRDRVFALLSLLHEVDRNCGIEPDYTKSVPDVYRDAAKKIITNHGNLRILGTVEMQESIERVPSWAPDWSIPNESQLLPDSQASGFSEAIVDFETEGIMKVQGKEVDSIQLVEPFNFKDDQSRHNTAAEIKRVLSRLKLADESPTRSGSESIRLACRTLCANNFAERYIPPRTNWQTLSQAQADLVAVLYQPFESYADKSSFLLRDVRACYSARSMFRTSKGYIGLAPRAARPGDVVTVLLGSRSPIVLRPNTDRRFKFVGEAYCDGFMQGEALLGPLPTGFDVVGKWTENSGSYLDGFLNVNTGTWQVEDPRSEHVPLPLGWRVQDHAMEDWYHLFVNDVTGEETWYDPRLTAESLKERGVDIQEFELI